MYEIYERADGKWNVCCMIQDGTERWEEADLETAIKSLKKAAKTLNNSVIKRKDITITKLVSTIPMVSPVKKAEKVDLLEEAYILLSYLDLESTGNPVWSKQVKKWLKKVSN